MIFLEYMPIFNKGRLHTAMQYQTSSVLFCEEPAARELINEKAFSSMDFDSECCMAEFGVKVPPSLGRISAE